MQIYKPDSVEFYHLSRIKVALNRLTIYPPRLGEKPSSLGLFDFSTPKVYQACKITFTTGELLPHLFTLIPNIRDGLFSVALSVTLAFLL